MDNYEPLDYEEARQIIHKQTSKGGPGIRDKEAVRRAAAEADRAARKDIIKAMNKPDIGGHLIAMSEAAVRASRTSADPAAARRRAALRSLQFFEHATGLPVTVTCPPTRYVAAADPLIFDGDPDAAGVLHEFATLLFQVHGQDTGYSQPAATRERWRDRQQIWDLFPLADPLPGTPRAVGGRAADEDDVLARLLRCPEDDEIRELVAEDMFTSHLRAELCRAAVSDDPGSVHDRWEYALLCAPGGALDSIGWPGHDLGHRYLDRLLHAEVTGTRARAALETITAARDRDMTAGPVALTGQTDLRLLARRPQRTQDAGIRLEVPAAPPPRKPLQPGDTEVRISFRGATVELDRALKKPILIKPARFYTAPSWMPGYQDPRPAPPDPAPEPKRKPGPEAAPRRATAPKRPAARPRPPLLPPQMIPPPDGPTPTP